MRKVKYLFTLLFMLFIGIVMINTDTLPNNIAEAASKIKAPSISKYGREGVYSEITIEANKECTIYYTIDGTEPTKKSCLYDKPIMLKAGKKYIIKAVACQGNLKSQVISYTYNEKLSLLGTKVKKIIRDNIKSDMTDFEKVMTIMVYFENNVRYDMNSTYCFDATGALVYNRAICSGYSSGFWLMMKMLNIPCKCVTGDVNWYGSKGAHAWNMVKLEGKWYMLEPQGDYVLLSDKEFKNKGYKWIEEDYPKCSQDYFPSVKSLTVSVYMMDIMNELDFTNMRFENVEKIVVKKGVKNIKDYAFAAYKKLTTVDISDTVEEIGDGSFANCASLTTISIPNAVKMVGNGAFKATPWLENQKNEFIIVGDGVLIDDNLTDYTNVEIPDTVKVISGAFAYTETLEKVSIPNSVTKIVHGAFDNSSVRTVIIPDSVTEIGDNVFRSCVNLSDVRLPNNLKKLGERAFCGCRSLERIELPDGLESIGIFAFDYCTNLNEVLIPDSVIDIYSSFNNTPWIKTYPDDYVIVGDSILLYYKGTDSILTIPEGVKTITNAFRDIDTIQKVILPTSLIKISDYAFFMQSKLYSINIPEGVTYIGDCAFYETGLNNITIPGSVKSIGREAFQYCSNLKKITIKDGVESIGDGAFMDSALETITIPKSVKNIGIFIFPEKDNKSDLKVICDKGSVAYKYALLYGASIEYE